MKEFLFFVCLSIQEKSNAKIKVEQIKLTEVHKLQIMQSSNTHTNTYSKSSEFDSLAEGQPWVTFGVFFSSIIIGQTHSQEIMQRFFFCRLIFQDGLFWERFFFKVFKWGRKCELFFIYLLSLRENTIHILDLFFITDVRSCKERIGLAFRAFSRRVFFSNCRSRSLLAF